MRGSSAGEGGIYNGINLSLYHYGGNNPIRYTDPTGLFDWETNTIESGDTLNQIAKDCNTRYGTNYTADDLQGLNSGTISDKDKIYAGNHLNLGKAEDVQKRAADYINRATIRYSDNQVTPILQNKRLGRGTNIAIGMFEIFGGGVIVAGSVIGALTIDACSGGAATATASWSVLEGWGVGSTFIAFGITRLTNSNNSKFSEDIKNVFLPSVVNIAEEMDKISKELHDE